jgi:ligand-binding sensor domain-containing protein/anti-sigma regulatory factor (Ser/Thr protein kinase)
MYSFRRVILFISYAFFISGISAQQNINLSFRHITQADGLLHNQVLSITQDEKGFIWIATSNGLQRYDGFSFLYFPEMISDPTESNATGATIDMDKKNNLLWISNDINLEKMELSKNNFTIYNLEKNLASPPFHYEQYSLNKGHLLLGDHALYYYDSLSKKNILKHIYTISNTMHQSSFIATDSTGNYTWATAGTRLFLFNKKSKIVYSDAFNPEQHPLLQPSIFIKDGYDLRFLMIDSKQDIWVTTWGNLFYRYDSKTKKVSRYSLSAIKIKEQGSKGTAANLLINFILEDDHHTIWIATENAGLLRYNPEKNNFDYCISQEKNIESIHYTYKIVNLFQDKEQNIWVSTDKGINIFNPYRQNVKYIRHQEGNPLSISKSEITSFVQTNTGDIFIGTWGEGITKYDSSFNFKKSIHFNGPYENNLVWSMTQVDNNTLWIGCQHGHLLVYDIKSGKVQTLHPPEMEDKTIRCMEKDRFGNIWFGLQNGKITKWDKNLNRFLPYGNHTLDSVKQVPVQNIFIDKENHCWVSTESGFKEFDLNKRIYVNTWLPDKNNSKSIFGKDCQGVEEYNDSILLIGTIFGGINFFNKRAKTFSHLMVADGMSSNSVYAIKKDAKGFIWFTTDYGLYRFDPANKKFIPYNMQPGVLNSSFTATKFYALQNEQWASFSTAEVIIFSPEKSGFQQGWSTIVEITGFKLFDKPLVIDSLLFEDKPIKLSYKENFITIEFATLNFSNIQQTDYCYRLSNVDKDWVNGGRRRFANYTNLQPGEYIFEVKAINENINNKITSFKIIITPPFWETVWFKILGLVILAGIIYSIAKWRANYLHNDEKKKIVFNKQMAEMEMKALRSQMNPHFIFNCINSIDALIQSNDKYHATVYLNKFAKLIRNILDSSKQNTVSLAKDLYTLKLYIELEQLRHENKFIAEINADEVLLEDDYKVPPLIIQPFVENAILHGIRYRPDNNGRLSITVSRKDDYLQYIIEDNGVGRSTPENQSKKEKKSYGIDMSNERVKLFNNEEKASVQITDLFYNGASTGTKVEVSLKIQ